MSLGRRSKFVGAAAAVLVIVVGLLGGAATSGHAATTQQVGATLSCAPTTVAPGTTTGCLLTVTNNGGNSVNNVGATVTATAGTFVSSTDSRCTPNGITLTCSFGKLAAGANVKETHELQVPSSGTTPVVQSVTGRYSSSTGNNRGNDDISAPPPVSVSLDDTADFDGKFANGATDSVQTDPVSTGNPYSTGATLGTTGFAVGLTVKEKAAGSNNPNCPSTGCFGAQVIDFEITPLGDSAFPASFTLTIKVYVGPGVQPADLDVRHSTTLHGTNPVPLCSSNTTDPSGDCISSRTVQSNTKIATIVVTGPGDGNGSWGVG